MSFRERIRNRIRPERDQRPPPPPNAANYIVLILDSCRFDSFSQANLSTVLKLGELQKRYAYASWTAPSHYNLLMGLLPHPSPSHIFASTYYKEDFRRFGARLNIENIDFAEMIPRMWLPNYLRNTLGYYTRAIVSMPVLNHHTPLAVDFDSYEMTEAHNDLNAIIDKLRFDAHRPTFYLLNTGETHYPYATVAEPETDWPKISGAHGTFKRISSGEPISIEEEPDFFSHSRLRELHQRQIHVLSSVEQSIEKLFDIVPSNTFITITSDHGELFGEGNYFGHGPIQHEKVFEVPFIEGKIR